MNLSKKELEEAILDLTLEYSYASTMLCLIEMILKTAQRVNPSLEARRFEYFKEKIIDLLTEIEKLHQGDGKEWSDTGLLRIP